jgi:hypothetical protein
LEEGDYCKKTYGEDDEKYRRDFRSGVSKETHAFVFLVTSKTGGYVYRTGTIDVPVELDWGAWRRPYD